MARIKYKIIPATCKALHCQIPTYIKELLKHYFFQKALRYVNAGLLVTHKVSKRRLGGRSFSYLAHLLWKHLLALV